MRRYAIMMIIIGMPTLKYAQIFGQLYSTGAVIWFLWQFRPFMSRFLNAKEALNEVFVMLAAYPLFLCTTWVFDEDARFVAGWLILGCLGGSILFNIGCFVIALTYQLKLRCKRCRARR